MAFRPVQRGAGNVSSPRYFFAINSKWESDSVASGVKRLLEEHSDIGCFAD
jgi:hypothetical protein